MRRLFLSFVVICCVIIPTPAVSTAAEKCLSSFSDAEWVNGTPPQVKALLGFDLIEKMTKVGGIPPMSVLAGYDSFLVLGEHIERTTYTYVGKNCESRDVVVTENISDVKPGTYKYKTIESALVATATNFENLDNARKFITNLRAYFATNFFQIPQRVNKITGGQINVIGSSRNVFEIYVKEASKYPNGIFPPGAPVITFPTKCGFITDTGGNDKVYLLLLRNINPVYNQEFIKTGECVAQLRFLNVEEKITDMTYLVSEAMKPTSITCISGKKTRKVTSIAPVCPKGYKKI